MNNINDKNFVHKAFNASMGRMLLEETIEVRKDTIKLMDLSLSILPLLGEFAKVIAKHSPGGTEAAAAWYDDIDAKLQAVLLDMMETADAMEEEGERLLAENKSE